MFKLSANFITQMASMLKIGKNILLIIVSITITLIVLEISFRLFDIRIIPGDIQRLNFFNSIQIGPHPFYPNYNGNLISHYLYKYKPNSIWASQYPSNNRGYFNKKNQIIYKINSNGYRDFEFKAKKPEIYRIICIGDSITFGEGVKLEDTFPKILEKQLRVKNHNIEIYNLGISGYGIKDEVASIDKNLEQYKPDSVIWAFVLNDISHAAFDEWPEKINIKKSKAFIKTSSWVINYAQERIWRIYSSKAFISFVLETYQNTKYWNEFTTNFKKAIKSIKEADANLLILIFPSLDALNQANYPFKPIHTKLSSFFENEKLRFIDLSNIFKEYGPLKLKVHHIDGHPNEIAHCLVAEQIMKFISSNSKLKEGLRFQNDT